MPKITNMVTVRTFDVMFHEFNANKICTLVTSSSESIVIIIITTTIITTASNKIT
jgi:hypothetical protein